MPTRPRPDPGSVRLLGTAVALVALAAMTVAQPAALAQVEDPADVLAVAHRGGSAYAPENTILALENAARHGADAVEFDVLFSADDELVVIHDATLERTTDCEGAVVDHTLEQLRECDAAHWFSPGQPVTQPDEERDHPLRGTGVSIPTLDEVFAWGADLGEDGPLLFVDVKTIPGEEGFDPIAQAYAEEILRLADEHGVTDRIVVLAFWPTVLDWVQVLDPDVPTKFLSTTEFGITAMMNLTYSIAQDYDISGPNFDAPDFNEQYVAAAHGAGKQVSTWTVNERDDIESVLEVGPDAITSDFHVCQMIIQGRDVPDQMVPDEVLEAGHDDIAPCPGGVDPRDEEPDEARPADDPDADPLPADDEADPLPATGGSSGTLALAAMIVALLALPASRRNRGAVTARGTSISRAARR